MIKQDECFEHVLSRTYYITMFKVGIGSLRLLDLGCRQFCSQKRREWDRKDSEHRLEKAQTRQKNNGQTFSTCYKVDEKAMRIRNRYNRIPHPIPKHKQLRRHNIKQHMRKVKRSTLKVHTLASRCRTVQHTERFTVTPPKTARKKKANKKQGSNRGRHHVSREA